MGIAFGGVANIIEGQIIQEQLDFIRVLIVPTEKFNLKDRNVLLKNMRERLGDDNSNYNSKSRVYSTY